MKEVREYTVQTIDEFSDEDKQKILDKYREINTEFNDWYEGDWYVEGLKEMGFYIKHDDISFDLGRGCYANFDCDGVDLDFLLADLDIKHKDFWIAHLKDNDMNLCCRAEDYPYWDSNSYLEYDSAEERLPFCHAEYQRIKDHLEDKVQKACDWLYDALKSEYEYLESDEAVLETIEANEYMFDTRTLKIA